jgi:dienelactone hydrolase
MSNAEVVDNEDSTIVTELRSLLVAMRENVLSTALSKDEAKAVIQFLGKDHCARLAAERQREMEHKGEMKQNGKKIKAMSLMVDDKTLRWLEVSYGKEPSDGHSLWISLHGGGNVSQVVNNQQCANQTFLYAPAEGIYIAPRAPSDTWNLWHEEHIDAMFPRLIENYVAVRGVNPDKVYLMGYSAGGDGVWQLAPRMADRFAAAATMAGHPNDASLDGLRNLPFAIFMGGNDTAYNRNTTAIEKVAQLNQMEQSDPGAYIHMSRIYQGLGHWMNGRDAEALPWMASFRRNAWPRKIVWVQSSVIHDRFYWLKIPDKAAAMKGQKIVASVEGQTILLDGDVPSGISLLLSDALLNLDLPVSVIVNGTQTVSTQVMRTAGVIKQSLEERLDLSATATANLMVPPLGNAGKKKREGNLRSR